MALRALIFDVDGTLADTEDLHRQAFNAAFVRHGLPWRWGRSAYAGLLKVTGGKERLAHFIALTEEPEAEKARLKGLIGAIHASKTQAYLALVERGVPLRSGIAQLIEDARKSGLRLAIATTTTPENVSAILAATLGAPAVNWFDVIAAGDQVAHKKPAPDVYRLVLDRLQLSAGECLAFEDSRNGLLAAKAAGLCTVVAPSYWTAKDNLSRADLLVAEFGDACGLDGLRALHSDWLAQRVAA